MSSFVAHAPLRQELRGELELEKQEHALPLLLTTLTDAHQAQITDQSFTGQAKAHFAFDDARFHCGLQPSA